MSRRAAFHKFTNNILELVNIKLGYGFEAICFVDLTYQHYIKNSYFFNKERIFQDNIHLSAFAYIDKGDIWTTDGKKITPLRSMFDPSTKFLRVTFVRFHHKVFYN